MTKGKKLGFWILSSLVIGNMIGSGVYLLPASLASIGTITIFSWILTAIGAMFLALVFAKLSRMLPKTGGPYIYCREAFGEFVGFQVAYNYWIYMWVGNAAIAVALTGYLNTFFPILATSKSLSFIVSVGAVWFFTFINITGIHRAGMFQLILTILKLIPLFFIAFIGIFFIKKTNLTELNLTPHSDLRALSSGAILTLWAFLGLESASIPADDVDHPEKVIPRATIFGTLFTGIIYIVSTIAIMGVIPPHKLQHSVAPFSDMAGQLFGPWGKYLVGLGAVIATAGVLNGWILLQGQIPYAAAQDRLFPKRFGKKSSGGAPVFGIVLSSFLVTILLFLNLHKSLVNQFTFIISLATLAAIIAYLYTTVAEMILIAKKRVFVAKSKIIRSLVLASLAFIYAFWATISAGKEIVFYGALLLFTSIPIYAYMAWNKHRLIDRV